MPRNQFVPERLVFDYSFLIQTISSFERNERWAHEAAADAPIVALKGMKRIYLKAGESKNLSFELAPEDLGIVNKSGYLVNKADHITIYIGGGQPQYPTATSGNAVTHDIFASEFAEDKFAGVTFDCRYGENRW